MTDGGYIEQVQFAATLPLVMHVFLAIGVYKENMIYSQSTNLLVPIPIPHIHNVIYHLLHPEFSTHDVVSGSSQLVFNKFFKAHFWWLDFRYRWNPFPPVVFIFPAFNLASWSSALAVAQALAIRSCKVTSCKDKRSDNSEDKGHSSASSWKDAGSLVVNLVVNLE